MAAYGNVLDFVIEQNVRCQYAVDDGDDLSDKKQDESAPSSPGMSATSEDCVEERYKVDRRKLEQMIQEEHEEQSAERFFDKIMQECNVQIAWPSKLKIGAKSKKDPHVKVCGSKADVMKAKCHILEMFDVKLQRVTLKMEICHTEHSHIIGKAGNNIKNVMTATGCHVHFPDSNRSTSTGSDKNNQVSVAGVCSSVEQARLMIRELAPLVLMFNVAVPSSQFVDGRAGPATVQMIQQRYGVSVVVRVQQKQFDSVYTSGSVKQLVTVRGSVCSVEAITQATSALFELFTGHKVISLPVCLLMEIAVPHHQTLLGENGANVRRIMLQSGTAICFPNSLAVAASHHQNTVQVTGLMSNVLHARQLLLDCLPLVLMFDVRQELDICQVVLKELMDKLNVCIDVKMKMKQNTKTVFVRSVERNAANIYEARRQILALGSEIRCCQSDQQLRDSSPYVHSRKQLSSPSSSECMPTTTSTNLALPTAAARVVRCPLVSSSPLHSPLSVMSPASAHVSVVWPSLHSPTYLSQTTFVRPCSLTASRYPMQSYLHCTLAGAVERAAVGSAIDDESPAASIASPGTRQSSLSSPAKTLVANDHPALSLLLTPDDFSTRNLPTDARGCSNSVTVYESHDVLKEDETCTGWSHGDRCNLLSDQQTADIIRDCLEKTQIRTDIQQPLVSTSASRMAMAPGHIVTTAVLNYIDYERKKLLANQAMMKKPVGERRTPTDLWAGLGFSKSMPDAEIHNWLDKGLCYRGPGMSTTYEEDEEKSCDSAQSSSKCAADPLQQDADDADEVMASQSSVLTNTSGAASAASPDVTVLELVDRLGLAKYARVFIEQEIDMASFLTLTDKDLKELGITTFGARRKLLLTIAEMSKPKQCPSVSRPPPGLPNPYTAGSAAHRHSLAVASQSGRW